MSDTRRFWLVFRLMNWEDIRGTVGPYLAEVRPPPSDSDQPCAFLPLFSTREEAESWSEEGTYRVQEVEACPRPS